MKRPAGLGVCVPLSSINHDGARIDAMLAELQPDWWMNWSYNTYGAQDDRFVPMIWGNQWSEGAVQDALTSLSPRTWLIHNEPHRQDQANLTPMEAAADVRRFMRVAWETGVEFQMALGGCGVVDETTDGIAWMRELMYNLRRTGLSRSSYMHFHGYRFNSVAQMQRGLEKFMVLWDEVGLGAPIIVSEFCAENTEPRQQMLIMDEARRWIDDDLIYGACWYSALDSGAGWPNSNLIKHDGDGYEATQLGSHWKGLM